MNGRFFGGQRITATIADGKEKFKMSKDDEESQRKRQEAYGEWLEENE